MMNNQCKYRGKRNKITSAKVQSSQFTGTSSLVPEPLKFLQGEYDFPK